MTILNKSVTIRIDCNSAIGAGHLHRCLSLADALSGIGLPSQFVVRPFSVGLAKLVQERGHCLTVMREGECIPTAAYDREAHQYWLGVDSSRDAKELIAAANGNILVVDHYGIDLQWLEYVEPHFEAVVCIDDMAHLDDYPVDLVINPHPSSNLKWYPNSHAGDTKFLFGVKGIFIADSWRKSRSKYQVRNRVDTIGLIPGGTDPMQLTERLLPCLLDLKNNCQIVVMFKPESPRRESLQESYGSSNRVRFIFDSNDIAEEVSRHDLVIGTAGSGSWERSCLGVPQIAVRATADQFKIAKFLEKEVCAVVDIEHPRFEHSLMEITQKLIKSESNRRHISNLGKALISGSAADDVAKLIKGFVYELEP